MGNQHASVSSKFPGFTSRERRNLLTPMEQVAFTEWTSCRTITLENPMTWSVLCHIETPLDDIEDLVLLESGAHFWQSLMRHHAQTRNIDTALQKLLELLKDDNGRARGGALKVVNFCLLCRLVVATFDHSVRMRMMVIDPALVHELCRELIHQAALKSPRRLTRESLKFIVVLLELEDDHDQNHSCFWTGVNRLSDGEMADMLTFCCQHLVESCSSSKRFDDDHENENQGPQPYNSMKDLFHRTFSTWTTTRRPTKAKADDHHHRKTCYSSSKSSKKHAALVLLKLLTSPPSSRCYEALANCDETALNYHGLYTTLIETLPDELMLFMLYGLMRHHVGFFDYITTKFGLEHLLLPILRCLYEENETTTTQKVSSVLILSLLTQDESCCHQLHECLMLEDRQVSWYECTLGEIPLGHFIWIIILRVYHHNFVSTRDDEGNYRLFIHQACFGMLVNLMRTLRRPNLHWKAGQNFIQLLVNFHKTKHNIQSNILNDDDDDPSPRQEEKHVKFQAYAEIVDSFYLILATSFSSTKIISPTWMYNLLRYRETFEQLVAKEQEHHHQYHHASDNTTSSCLDICHSLVDVLQSLQSTVFQHEHQDLYRSKEDIETLIENQIRPPNAASEREEEEEKGVTPAIVFHLKENPTYFQSVLSQFLIEHHAPYRAFTHEQARASSQGSVKKKEEEEKELTLVATET